MTAVLVEYQLEFFCLMPIVARHARRSAVEDVLRRSSIIFLDCDHVVPEDLIGCSAGCAVSKDV